MIETFRVDPAQVGELGPALGLIRRRHGPGRDCLLVGAAARDLLLHHVYGVGLVRATRDVERRRGRSRLGCLRGVDGAVRARLWVRTISTGAAPSDAARLVDVLPFGEIASETSRLLWPGEAREMSTLGYAEARAAAVGISRSCAACRSG